MKPFRCLFKPKGHRRYRAQDVEARFLRLYSRWHETHDLTIRKKLLVKLRLLTRQIPDFDIRSRFRQAF